MRRTDEEIDDAPVVLSTEHVSKRFVVRRDNSLKDRLLAFRQGRRHREAFTALDDISLQVRAGHTVALIGHNGSGKSTLLKLIGGILDPSEGTIARRGRVAALLELGAGFHPDLSGRDNVFLNASLLGMSRAETEAVFDDVVAFAELEDFIDTQVKFYSSGMYVRLAFAVAVHTDPDILLVDEVLAVGDEAFQRKCMDVIRRFQHEGRTILLVTHNLGQVVELCDSAVLLHHGALVFEGEPVEAVATFRDLLEERRLEHEERRHEHQVATASEGAEPERGPQLEITAVVSVDGRDAGEPARPGDRVRVAVGLRGQLDSPGWMCSIQIDNTMGLSVFGTASDRLEVELPPIDGELDLEFALDDTRFGEGQYFVNVSVLDREGVHLRDRPQACAFQARAPKATRGVLSLPAELRVRPRPA